MDTTNETSSDLVAKVITWIEQIGLKQQSAVEPDTQLITEGLLDSMGLLQLVIFIEEDFGITLDPELLVPENFYTPNSIASLINRIARTGSSP